METTQRTRVAFCSLFALLLCLLAAPSVTAQDGYPRYTPERTERKTEKGEDGKLVWAKWAFEKCRFCTGTGKTTCKACEKMPEEVGCPDCKRKDKRQIVCRTCIGEGTLPDPLEKVHCPGCAAAGFLICTVCNGGGKIRIKGAKRYNACPACRGAGAWKCEACDGERFVGGAKLKPSLAECEDPDKIQDALEVAEEMLKDLEKFKPEGGDKARKEVKELQRIIKVGYKDFVALKAFHKQAGKYMGKIFAGKQFVGAADHESYAMNRIKEALVYYVKMQKQMLTLAKQRAEANVKIEEENKGK